MNSQSAAAETTGERKLQIGLNRHASNSMTIMPAAGSSTSAARRRCRRVVLVLVRVGADHRRERVQQRVVSQHGLQMRVAFERRARARLHARGDVLRRVASGGRRGAANVVDQLDAAVHVELQRACQLDDVEPTPRGRVREARGGRVAALVGEEAARRCLLLVLPVLEVPLLLVIFAAHCVVLLRRRHGTCPSGGVQAPSLAKCMHALAKCICPFGAKCICPFEL